MTSDEIACIGRISDELANLKVGSMSRRLEADMMALGVDNLHDLSLKLSQMLLRNGSSLVVFGGGGGGGGGGGILPFADTRGIESMLIDAVKNNQFCAQENSDSKITGAGATHPPTPPHHKKPDKPTT
jgi:hypothetical protein